MRENGVNLTQRQKREVTEFTEIWVKNEYTHGYLPKNEFLFLSVLKNNFMRCPYGVNLTQRQKREVTETTEIWVKNEYTGRYLPKK